MLTKGNLTSGIPTTAKGIGYANATIRCFAETMTFTSATISRASLVGGKISPEIFKDRHSVGVLIVADHVTPVTEAGYEPSEHDLAFMAPADGNKQIHFICLNGCARKFKIEDGGTTNILIYKGGKLTIS